VAQRIRQLRYGGANAGVNFVSFLSGLVPFLKIWTIHWCTMLFTDFSIQMLGLGDRPDVNRLQQEACSKAGLVTNVQEFCDYLEKQVKKQGKKQIKHSIDEPSMDSDLREHLKEEMRQHINDEFGVEAGTQLAEEAVHLNVGFGQLISMGRGLKKANKNIDKALDLLERKAVYVHLKVFAVNALARTM
jgi:hypothetical protein